MTPWLDDGDVRLYHGDNLDVLRTLPDKSVHMCCTSPPFYGLRDYGVDGQIGLEETPDQWVQNLVRVFREVRRVLRDDGTLWVEIGDSYASTAPGTVVDPGVMTGKHVHEGAYRRPPTPPRTKPKDLIGQPWLLALALRADGWYLRSEIIWARPNPMPESVTDRPTKSHSTVFLLSKQPRYFYDADAIREPSLAMDTSPRTTNGQRERTDMVRGFDTRINTGSANARSVWTIPTQPTPFAHFATWPEALCRRMILAGTSERGCCPCGAPWVRDTQTTGGNWEERKESGLPLRAGFSQAYPVAVGTSITRTIGWSPSCEHGTPGCPLEPVPCTVLDPFAGSATTMLVARHHGRHSIGIELNESYLEIAAKRLQQLSLLA